MGIAIETKNQNQVSGRCMVRIRYRDKIRNKDRVL